MNLSPPLLLQQIDKMDRHVKSFLESKTTLWTSIQPRKQQHIASGVIHSKNANKQVRIPRLLVLDILLVNLELLWAMRFPLMCHNLQI